MKRLKKNTADDYDSSRPPDPNSQSVLMDPDKKSSYNPIRLMASSNPTRLMGIIVVCLIFISVLFSVSVVFKDPPSDIIREASETRVLEGGPRQGTCFRIFEGFKY